MASITAAASYVFNQTQEASSGSVENDSELSKSWCGALIGLTFCVLTLAVVVKKCIDDRSVSPKLDQVRLLTDRNASKQNEVTSIVNCLANR